MFDVCAARGLSHVEPESDESGSRALYPPTVSLKPL